VRLSCGAFEAAVSIEDGRVSIDGRELDVRVVRRPGTDEIEGVETDVAVTVARDGDRVFVWCDGRAFEIRRLAAAARATSGGSGAASLLSPMPGRVRRVLVAPGEEVTRGQVLLVLEAMKMEHAIRSPRDGRVVRIDWKEGDLVEAGVPLAEIGER
jgi:3-methylcrotonyl-CoA carboxylase alpha subunit